MPWDALQETGALGVGLWETGRPRLRMADAGLCNALGREPGSLDGAAASEVEYNHPFAWSIEAWRRHQRTVQTFGRVDWPTWLLTARRALLCGRSCVCNGWHVEGSEYMLAELLEVAANEGGPRARRSSPGAG